MERLPTHQWLKRRQWIVLLVPLLFAIGLMILRKKLITNPYIRKAEVMPWLYEFLLMLGIVILVSFIQARYFKIYKATEADESTPLLDKYALYTQSLDRYVKFTFIVLIVIYSTAAFVGLRQFFNAGNIVLITSMLTSWPTTKKIAQQLGIGEQTLRSFFQEHQLTK